MLQEYIQICIFKLYWTNNFLTVLQQEHYGLQEAYILYNKRTKLEHSIESNENVIINLTNNELMILGMILMDEKV